MQAQLQDLLERGKRRRHAVAALAGLSLFYVVFAGLGAGWAIAGIALACAWAALWPEADGSATDIAGRGKGETGSAGQPFGEGILVRLLEGLPDAAVLLNSRALIIDANAAARSIGRVAPGRQLSSWCRSPELLTSAERAHATMTQQRCHVRLFTPVERSLDVLVTPARASGDEGAHFTLITCRDLTEQEQLSRMRVEFVANASHELRTPLASLRGFIETLQGAAKDDPGARGRFLSIMQAQAERMSRLIEDLLSLSRIEMREHVAPEAKVDLAAVAVEAASSLKPQAEAAGITLVTNISGGSQDVTGDRDELAQVAQNLVQNAIKYGRTGGKVEVTIVARGDQIALEVADDGLGIAPEHLPRLTERFYRVNAKDSKDRGGTGLGLAIVKHIVNRHRGELQIKSTPGEGSTFSVLLPRLKDA